MSIAMIISTTVQPGKREEVHALWLERLAPLAEMNETQATVVWCDDHADQDVFHLFEIYADEQAFGLNAQSQEFADYMTAVMPLLAGEPVVKTANPRWIKGAA